MCICNNDENSKPPMHAASQYATMVARLRGSVAWHSTWKIRGRHCKGSSLSSLNTDLWSKRWKSMIATARVLPKATQRELFRLGAYPRYSQSHYWQRCFSELWFWSILGIIAHMVSRVIAIFTESLQHKTVYNSLMDISHTYNSLSDVTIHEKMYYNC